MEEKVEQNVEQNVEQKEFLEIEIDVQERTNHETGEKFLSFKGLSKKGYIDLKFTRDVKDEEKPNHSCIIVVPVDKINVNRKSKFPVAWVSQIKEVKEFEFKQNTSEYFE